MLHVQNNPSGALRVRWPKYDAEILSLAAQLIAYESSLTTEQQLKELPMARIQAAYTNALAAVNGAGSGEAARAIASETLRQKVELAKFHLDFAISHLKVKYRANLAQLELWGLETVIGSTGIRIRKPRNQSEWITFLQAYVTREASLAVAQQLTIPALAEMQALNADIQAALSARAEGRTARETGVESRSAAAEQLLDLLRLACAILVALKFDGELSNELQRWGYLVQTRPAPQPKETPQAEAN